MQSVSLVNRLLTIPSTFSSNEEKDRLTFVNQSMLLSNLISSLTKNRSHHANSSLSDYTIIQNTTNLSDSDSNSTRDIINKNNQFLLQLNLLVSKSSSSGGNDRDNLAPNLLIDIYDSAHGINWFYLLAKMLIYKSNGVLDSLLFSIFRKISILTPRLFGSLLGPFANQMHSIIFSKLSDHLDSRIICIISEFLSALVEYQPGFFQTLADLRTTRPPRTESSTLTVKQEITTATETYVEGEKSILKALFSLLDKLTSIKDEVTLHSSGLSQLLIPDAMFSRHCRLLISEPAGLLRVHFGRLQRLFHHLVQPQARLHSVLQEQTGVLAQDSHESQLDQDRNEKAERGRKPQDNRRVLCGQFSL